MHSEPKPVSARWKAVGSTQTDLIDEKNVRNKLSDVKSDHESFYKPDEFQTPFTHESKP